MKNENTDTINRAIHSAMGLGCWHENPHYEKDFIGTTEVEILRCEKCGNALDDVSMPENSDYTVPGQPLEDAKAWAVKKVGISEFGYLVLKYSGQHTNTNRYYPIGLAATLPALDMAKIICKLIDEGEK